MTIACASVASVLRPCPVSKTRARAASLAGTSSTRSPLGQEPLREGAADPVRAFHRPDPLRPLPRDLQQLAVAAPVGGELAGGPQDLPVVPGFDRYRQLVRVNPDDHPVHHHASSPQRITLPARTGNAITS